MPASFKSFDRVVTFEPGTEDTKWLEANLAQLAVAELRQAQARGEANSRYIRAINGRIGDPEQSVIAPGDIVYSFSWMNEAAQMARELLITFSPVRSGFYRNSFSFVANGIQVPLATIKHQKIVEVVNTQPYSRKIQVGANGFEEYRGLFDLAARRLRSQFKGVVEARAVFVRLSTAVRLKRGTRSKRLDRGAGAELTYPAIRLTNLTTSFVN